MIKKTKKSVGAYILSFLILFSNFSSTFAMVRTIVNDNFLNTGILPNTEGGAIPLNQVDLATGNVTLQEPIFTIEGYQASLTYNSEGVSKKASIWNRDQMQGIIGLGWEYPEDKIIRLTQQTGTLADDKYVLYTKGNSFPLLFIALDNGEKEYRIAKQPDWVVKHHTYIDQWRLYHPDGQIYIYGDGKSPTANENLTSHQSNGVEYNVKWNNWIGSSSVIEGQERLPISYNIAAIEDIYGQQVQFYYNQHEEQVGGNGGLKHTRATYLSKVKGLRGKAIEFTYSKKNNYEFYDTHTEKESCYTCYDIVTEDGVNDKDAYQERYVDQFLSEITLKNRKENIVQRVHLEYDFLNKKTELHKRLLTRINYLDSRGDVYKPAKLFDYFGLNEKDGVKAGFIKEDTKLFNSATGAVYAAIKQQTLPEGVSYAYHYGKQKIKDSSTDIKIIFPTETENMAYDGVKSPWSAPELFYGSDYVVAIFESQDLTKRQSYVKVYQWIGDRWSEKDLGEFDGYFYDRYLFKDQYDKGVLGKVRNKIFKAIENYIPAAMGVLTGFGDVLKDTGKTFYKVGDDISHGDLGIAIKDWYSGEFKAIKDITMDIASGLEKEIEYFQEFSDMITDDKKGMFIDHQKKLFEARDKDAALNPRKVYHITLQDQFFALTTSFQGGSQVNIIQKNNIIPGEWTKKEKKSTITSKYFTFDSGDNFVVLLDEVTDFLYIYSWDGHIWSTYSRQLRTDFNERIVNNVVTIHP